VIKLSDKDIYQLERLYFISLYVRGGKYRNVALMVYAHWAIGFGNE